MMAYIIISAVYVLVMMGHTYNLLSLLHSAITDSYVHDHARTHTHTHTHTHTVGGFSAGWPFTHMIERYSWSTAIHSLTLASVGLVGVASYLLFLMVQGLPQIRKTD